MLSEGEKKEKEEERRKEEKEEKKGRKRRGKDGKGEYVSQILMVTHGRRSLSCIL